MGFPLYCCLVTLALDALWCSSVRADSVNISNSSIISQLWKKQFSSSTDNAENIALNFLKRFTCFTNCNDLYACVPEEDARKLESIDLKEEQFAIATLSVTLVNHVLRLNSDCSLETLPICILKEGKCSSSRYLATERIQNDGTTMSQLESAFDAALLRLKPFYQPVKGNKCFTSHDIIHDINSDAENFNKENLQDFMTTMFIRLSAGECIGVKQDIDFISDIFSRYGENETNSFLTEAGLEKLMSDIGIVRHKHDHDEHGHDHGGHDHDKHGHDHGGHDHDKHGHDHGGHDHDKHGHDHGGHDHDEHGHDHGGHDHDEHGHDHDEHGNDHDEHGHDHNKHNHEHDSSSLNLFVSDHAAVNISFVESPTLNLSTVLIQNDTDPDLRNTDQKSNENHNHLHKRDIHDHSNAHSLNSSNDCWDAISLIRQFDTDENGDIGQEEFRFLCPALIQQRLRGTCNENSPKMQRNPWEVYGYGTVAVFIISLCSILGAILMPIQHSSFYEYLMMCFIALAFGTLTGDALLHLIPESVGLHDHGDDGHDHHDHEEGLPPYFWKLFVILVSVYGLFVFEGLASLAVNGIRGEGKKSGHGHSHIPSIDLVQMTRKDGKKSVSSETLESRISNSVPANGDIHSDEHQISISSEKPKMCCGMTTLALVIIVGDAIHNVADGLTIGAAFSSDVKGGISSALAIFFHELPHEFGDFVILLSTGFTFKQAIIWNFISSLTAFIGLYVGIEIGENEEAREWILTVAAGMFLYIALGDMLPELKEQKGKNGLIAFFVQNVGVICGMTFMILMSVYENQIKI